MVPLDKRLQGVNVKQKPFRQIQAYSIKIWHIQELFRQIQIYSEPCVTLACLQPWYIQYSGTFRTRSIFRTLAYSQPWYIHNPGIFRTLVYSKSEAHSEPCQTPTISVFRKQLMATIIFTNYNYFCSISQPRSLLDEININLFNTGLIFTPEVVILCKKL